MNNGECISKNNNEPNESDIKNNWQNIAEKARFYNQLDQKASNLDYENKFNSETNIEPAKIVAVENKDNIYHIEGILNSENIAEINNFKNKTTLILNDTRGLSSEVLRQIDSDRVFFSVKGGLDYENIDKYNQDRYKERTMMSPKGLEKVVRYFERVEDEMDPSWSDTQKCMYAYNCLAVDMNYGENSDNILSKGTAARGLNGILYGELVCAGFAFTFQEMMNRSNIECHYQNQKDTHAYNVVKLDDKYYGIDVTWDNYNKIDNKCGFRNFGQDEHFYEIEGHKNYREELEWDDDKELITKRVYDDAEKRFNLSTFSIEELRSNYSIIANKISNRKNGSYHNFAEQPVEVREKYLPVTNIREKKLRDEANRDSADFLKVLRELQKDNALNLDTKILDILQPRINYLLDTKAGDYTSDNKSNFGELELRKLGAIQAAKRRGENYSQEEEQAVTSELNQQLEYAVGDYLSKIYKDISESIHNYEQPVGDMDNIRRMEETNHRTKMNLVLDSRDYLIHFGHDQSQVNHICNQIESKLDSIDRDFNISVRDKKKNSLDFLGSLFMNKTQIKNDIEEIEGIKLTDEDFNTKVHDANYLLNRIYTRLDLDEYGLTKDDFQELLNSI